MKPRVLFLSGREVGYMRNRVLLDALRMHFSVRVLTPTLRSTTGRMFAGLAKFLAQTQKYDLCFAGFYGQPIAIALSMLQREPIILDAYVSTFDTLCEDRHHFRAGSPVGRLARWLDRRSCQVATRVLTDTQAHARYFAQMFEVPESKLRPTVVGCDESLFYPREQVPHSPQRVEVFYYGAFLPLHGTEVIVQAAALLRGRTDIHFTLGGSGMCYEQVQRQVADLALTNIDLVSWIPLDRLPEYIAQATICLGGHFSTVPKATRVISTKTYQFVAMRKPTIVGDNPATQEILVHGEHVWAVPMGSPEALAAAIQTLTNDATLRQHIARGGYEVFQEKLTTSIIARQLATSVQEALCAFAS
jgi:glycosyltransferase involved in cell wall biosynthesis